MSQCELCPAFAPSSLSAKHRGNGYFLLDNRKNDTKQYVDTFIVELRKCFYIVLVLAVKNHKIMFHDTFFLSFFLFYDFFF